MARTPAIGYELAGEAFDGRSLRVILLAHQVKGHLAHQVDPVCGDGLLTAGKDGQGIFLPTLNETRKRRASSL
ncbi:hypothetical protein KAM385_16130 [Aeromonas hydrophila]|nr:hypothetical protein KAM385_16130 [Aeromonas hydrophila]CAD7557162.1 hypothetical protein KBAH04_38430 [Aeromonas hydrophila]